ncbi:hypothetical protein [Streptomyces sp. NPDC001315]|uniref:hypothetical protein n=1 Tax=Streptomyces sp. NPDC001315 TaxID=3364562 RepID=UPI0036A81802
MSARRTASAIHTLTVLALALAATWTTSLLYLPPALRQPVAIAVGVTAAFLALLLPCPCHRKDRSR